MLDAIDSPATGLKAGLKAGLHPGLQEAAIMATAPDAPLRDMASNLPPGAFDTPISDHDDAVERREKGAPAEALAGAGTPAPQGADAPPTSLVPPTPAAGGQVANSDSIPVHATPGDALAAIPGSLGAPASPLPPGPVSPGVSADGATPLFRATSEAAAPAPGAFTARPAGANTAAPVSPPLAPTPARNDPPPAPPPEPGAPVLRMTATVPAPAGDQARASGVTLPGPLPESGLESGLESGPKPGDGFSGRARSRGRGARPAPAALPIQASSPPPGGPPAGPGPMPVLPELPPAVSAARGPVVRAAVMQALGDSGLAVSSAAIAQSAAGPAPAVASPGHSGGAEMARAVAPQIAAAIGSGSGSGRIEIRLDPPELGRVEISLDIVEQSLRATLMADRPATNDLLRRHGEILLAQLQQAGFTEVDLQFAEQRGRGRGGAQPGITPWPASAGDHGAPPHGGNAERPAGLVARRTADGLDLRL